MSRPRSRHERRIRQMRRAAVVPPSERDPAKLRSLDEIVEERRRLPGAGPIQVCDQCQIVWQDGQQVVATFKGVLHEARVEFGFSVLCPTCHRPMRVVDPQVEVREPDGTRHLVYAATEEQLAQAVRVVERLRTLGERVSADEIARVIEEDGPELRPLADFVRANGLNLIAVVIALIAWLFPQSPDVQPSPPPTISREQLQELVDQLSAPGRLHESADPQGSNRHHHGLPDSVEDHEAGDGQGEQ